MPKDKDENPASKPTPPNAQIIGIRREGGKEEVLAPRRVYSCGGCGQQYVLEPDESVIEAGQVKPGVTLHFPFKCSRPGCKYSAAVGLS